MRKRKFINKAISIALSMAMVFSLVPTATYADSASMANGGLGGSYKSFGDGGGPGSAAWDASQSTLDRGMFGYRISVRFAPLKEGSSMENPEYDWTKSFQVGNTTYIRGTELVESPVISGPIGDTYSVYNIMNGTIWNDLKNDVRYQEPFWYWEWTTDDVDQTMIDSSVLAALSEFWNQGLVAGNTKGHQEVQKFLNRMLNMDENVDVSLDELANKAETHVFTDGGRFDPENPGDVFNWAYANGNTYMNPERLKLTFPDVLFKGGKTANDVNYDGEYSSKMLKTTSEAYLKSYFLNPVVLNRIAWYTRAEFDTNDGNQGIETKDENGNTKWVESFSVSDFVWGRYGNLGNEQYKYPQGVYKLYIEPTAYRNIEGKFAALTYQDFAAQHRTKTSTYSYAESLSEGFMAQIGEAMYMENPDDSIQGQTSADTGYHSASYGGLNYQTNGLGLWVLSSPSLSSYVDDNPPQIIKNYVKVTGVDKEGHVKFETVKEAVSEGAEFKVENGEQSRVPSNLADEEEIEIQDEQGKKNCTAYLNDYITVNRNVELKEGMNWEGEMPSLPANEEPLEKSAKDIVGYKLGVKVYNDSDVRRIGEYIALQMNLNIDVSTMSTEDLVNVTLAQLPEEKRGALFDSYIRNNYDVDAAFAEVGLSYDTLADEGAVIITETAGDGREAEQFDDTSDIILGKTDENGKTVKYEDSELGAGVANPATLIARYVVVPNARQYNVIEVVNKDTNEVRYYQGGESQIGYDAKDVEIKEPEIDDGIRSLGELVQIGWVTSSKVPPETEKFYEEGKLPDGESESKRGTSEKEIKEYPQSPSVHNLYVKWRIEYGSDPTNSGSQLRVPEWRLSKYFPAYLEDGSDTHKKI